MNPRPGNLSYLQDGPTAVRPTYRLIQALRAVAALMVVLHHESLLMWDRLQVATLGPGMRHNWINGATGVDIFFVISGFVMAISSAPLAGAEHPARTFLARRLERVMPMYWLLTTLKVLLILAAPSSSVNGLGGWQHVLSSYLFFPWQGKEPLLVVGWTLAFEMLFYALFALALGLRVGPLTLVGPVLIAAVAYVHAMSLSPSPFHVFLSYYAGTSIVLEFLFGILLAMALPWLRRLSLWPGLLMALAPWYWLCTWEGGNWSAWRAFNWGILALSVVAGALVLERFMGHLTPKWLLELGDASYSIYLTHGFVLPVCGVVLARMPQVAAGQRVLVLVGMLVLSAGVGEVVYRMVELPITRWFKGRRRTAVPAVG